MGASLELLLGCIQGLLMWYGGALGLNDALDLVERYHIPKVIIEMDNQSVVKAVKQQTTIRKRWGFVVDR
ncbi:hypothetical protein A2U01_0108363, partial [Trifolium medium]|nr:hypothetical protein [Trifolium medium]